MNPPIRIAAAALLVAGAACSDSTSPVVDPPVTPACAMAVGELKTFSGAATGCVTGASGTAAEFVLVAYNAAADGDRAISATITANGVATAPAAYAGQVQAPLSASRSLAGLGSSDALVPDHLFHTRQQARARAALTPRLPSARAWYQARTRAKAPTPVGGFGVSPSYATIPAGATVGDILTLNVNGNDACIAPIYRGVRVEAVGTKSVVLADTLNPAGGFSAADFQRFATRFDNLVYPLDVNNFGEPSDLDANGKVAILFTKAVNELTPANSESYVGGFFFSRDLFPRTAGPRSTDACAASNEAEIFYMLVPDPNGVVNGNRRRIGFVDTLTTGVLAHEFQHLINAGRRFYVNVDATSFEETWLNEGLSHIAEELLYYHESGKQPRQNLRDADIRVNSPSTYPFWKADASQNFSRLFDYLEDPTKFSPVASGDSLATRGSAWSFLRYAVDRLNTTESTVWKRFGNSVLDGMPSLAYGLGTDPAPLFRDWVLANYLDDTGFSADARFAHPSWNFRDIYAKTYVNGRFPLKVTPLVNAAPVTVQQVGLSASYFRLAVAAGQEAQLAFASGGSAPNASLQFLVMRTK
jgi:hypothetical protein